MIYIYNDISLLIDILMNMSKLSSETDSDSFNKNVETLSVLSTDSTKIIDKLEHDIKDESVLRRINKVRRNINLMNSIYFIRLKNVTPVDEVVQNFKKSIISWIDFYVNYLIKIAEQFHEEPKVNRIRPKVCICCIAKNENRYIREFIEYYQKLGIDHISIYDNNDPDGEVFNDVIQDYMDSGYVNIFNVRGAKRYQNRAYTEFYDKHHKEYDYIFFCDIDEFLVLHFDETIQDYLTRSIFDDAQVIHINWKVYGDGDNIKYDPRPVMKRFTNIFEPERETPNSIMMYDHVKSIVRCDVDPGAIVFRDPHTPYYPFLYVVNNEGERIPNTFNIRATYKLAQINHYYTKSLEEFLSRYKRGRADIIDDRNIDDFIQTFFMINQKTKFKEIFAESFKKKLEE